jgi:HlyD family secretion protein
MTANAEIVLEEHPNALLIPESAITYDPQKKPFVDVIAPGAPNGRRRTPIKVGVGNGTKIEVLEGLRPGEKLLLPG